MTCQRERARIEVFVDLAGLFGCLCATRAATLDSGWLIWIGLQRLDQLQFRIKSHSIAYRDTFIKSIINKRT